MHPTIAHGLESKPEQTSSTAVPAGDATAPRQELHTIPEHAMVLLEHRDPATRVLLRENLEADGLNVREVNDGASALETLQSTPIHAAILDASTPGLSGLDVLKRVRGTLALSTLPVLVLAEGEELERIIALELGADDCLLAPFTAREVRLRIRSLLRRHTQVTASLVVRASDFYFDAFSHEVRVNDQQVRLTNSEFRLLSMLVAKKGAITSRTDLVTALSRSGDEALEYRAINTHIRRLRQKLGQAGDRLMTVRGMGYRFSLRQ